MTVMREIKADVYISDDGYQMQREYGMSPNGNPLCGRWVLRTPSGEFVDYDQYRYDLFERYDFQT